MAASSWTGMRDRGIRAMPTMSTPFLPPCLCSSHLIQPLCNCMTCHFSTAQTYGLCLQALIILARGGWCMLFVCSSARNALRKERKKDRQTDRQTQPCYLDVCFGALDNEADFIKSSIPLQMSVCTLQASKHPVRVSVVQWHGMQPSRQ